MSTDFELLATWRGGDQSAGDELLGRHFPRVFVFFRSKAPQVAEDLAQRTFLGAVEARDRIDERGTFKAYLFGIARLTLFKYLRDTGRRPREEAIGETSLHDHGITPSQAVAGAQERQILLLALRRLPLDFQIAVELAYWEEMPGAQIATVLGVAEGTVRSRLTRAREMLRTTIKTMDVAAELRESTLTGFETWARSLKDEFAKKP